MAIALPGTFETGTPRRGPAVPGLLPVEETREEKVVFLRKLGKRNKLHGIKR
jgi:hypothetical protein